MGFLVDFEKKNLDGLVQNVDVTTMNLFHNTKHRNVATSPDRATNHADQENSIQHLNTSLQRKPGVINFSRYHTLPSYQNRFQQEAKDLHTPTGVDVYSLARYKTRDRRAKDDIGSLENAGRLNYVLTPLSTQHSSST